MVDERELAIHPIVPDSVRHNTQVRHRRVPNAQLPISGRY